MSIPAPAQPVRSPLGGLATYFTVLYAPRAAFERLSRIPTWGWAAIVGIILVLISLILTMPAQVHMASVLQQQRLSDMSADQRAAAQSSLQAAAGITKTFIYAAALVGPWIAWFITALFFLIPAAIGGGDAKFARAWVAALNSFVVWGVAGVVNAIIVSLRDPNTINAPADISMLPSLALFVHGNPKLAAFLFSYNLLYIWYYVVAVIALEIMLRVPRRFAVGFVIIYSLFWALIAMVTAR
ncbi:MAG: YIP1 family protein [Candidatus Eremiobacteraeota bacterium]|nr:YIP1 family protein [Candidatus Eremiobacteraeota bacterium]